MKNLFAVLMILILLFPLAFAAGTDDNTVNWNMNPGKLHYYGTVTCSDTASSATYYTQWFYVGACNYSYGYADFDINEVGTEDVNVFYEYSNDYTDGKLDSTDTDLDAVGTTQVYDTIGIANGGADSFKRYGWMRIKFVLGATNGGDGVATTPEVITWNTHFIIPEEAIPFQNRNFAQVQNDQD